MQEKTKDQIRVYILRLHNLTFTASNMHSDNVVKNVRIQVQEKSKLNAQMIQMIYCNKKKAPFNQLAEVLATVPNTFLLSEWIKSQANQFQAHLERIADFPLEGW